MRLVLAIRVDQGREFLRDLILGRFDDRFATKLVETEGAGEIDDSTESADKPEHETTLVRVVEMLGDEAGLRHSHHTASLGSDSRAPEHD